MWIYEGKPLETMPEKAAGFVYRIVHRASQRAYIGKKLFWSTRRIKQKGKKRRKVIVKESDWRSYISSSKPLRKEINRLGVDAFDFTVLMLCESKADMSYHETRLQFVLDVLEAKLPNGEAAYWNETILGRFFRR